MGTATKDICIRTSIDLPADDYNRIAALAREKRMSISKFISNLIKKESESEEEKRWRKISNILKEEQEDAAAAGFTEQDLDQLIKEVRWKKFSSQCEQIQEWAKEQGITEQDIAEAIKNVRKK